MTISQEKAKPVLFRVVHGPLRVANASHVIATLFITASGQAVLWNDCDKSKNLTSARNVATPAEDIRAKTKGDFVSLDDLKLANGPVAPDLLNEIRKGRSPRVASTFVP